MRTPRDAASLSRNLLGLLAHPQRWRLVGELARSDRRVHELVETVEEAPNLVSYHLKKLRDLRLVSERRSAFDGRDVYYSLDLDRLRSLYLAAANDLHPGLVGRDEDPGHPVTRNRRRLRVLFLCTHNSARSQMAEGLLRHLAGDRFEVASAGTEPSRVHPLATAEMARRGIDIGGHRSKSMQDFVEIGFDYVITVCDHARESCPVFPGDPERIHWSIEDPAAVDGTESQRAAAFTRAATELLTRIRNFVALAERGR
jgi:ArsR family transcriptional regulator, arsenate/arsenite/antimonite-responsive transcriptional repressor / arsenate reductase (thioredoxin)